MTLSITSLPIIISQSLKITKKNTFTIAKALSIIIPMVKILLTLIIPNKIQFINPNKILRQTMQCDMPNPRDNMSIFRNFYYLDKSSAQSIMLRTITKMQVWLKTIFMKPLKNPSTRILINNTLKNQCIPPLSSIKRKKSPIM